MSLESYYQSIDEEVYVPDTSVIVEGVLSGLVEQGKLRGKLLIHRAVLSELEQQANQGRTTGFAGLQEIKKLRELARKGLIDISVEGRYPTSLEIREAGKGRIDSLIREFAYETKATLITADRVQALVAEAMGVSVVYIPPRTEENLDFIAKYFDEETMSVHFKEGSRIRAKKGRPGNWHLVDISLERSSRRELEELANKIVEAAKRRPDGFIEIDREGSTIVQIANYRIVIVKPPLSEGWEITIVRPLKQLRLEDYNLQPKILKRLDERAEGILIAGAPGMGKTTFAQALARYYAEKGKVVKTIESPRDMSLPADVTQYSKSYASLGELHDILLLSRPDYTVFDELRNDEDFQLYIDLRLAGIGMIGVVHATSPIDAIQRFLRRVDLGMLPSILDTVIFINHGFVEKILGLRMTVKLPTGLREADLARPVVEVFDVITGELLYEIYTFGEQVMVIPIKSIKPGELSAAKRLLERMIPGSQVEVEDNVLTLIVPRVLAKMVMKKKKKIKKIEEKYGVQIRVNYIG